MVWRVLFPASVPHGMHYCCAFVPQVERDMIQGHTLEGFRRLLLLVLLQDPGPVGPGPLTTKGLAPLEDLLSKTPSGESDLFLSTVPNLLRMLNSGAGVIQ